MRFASEVAARLDGAADLITCDLSPKLTGIADRDQARSAELLTIALEFAGDVLKPGGAMIAKLFMGGEFEQIKRSFNGVREGRSHPYQGEPPRIIRALPGRARLSWQRWMNIDGRGAWQRCARARKSRFEGHPCCAQFHRERFED